MAKRSNDRRRLAVERPGILRDEVLERRDIHHVDLHADPSPFAQTRHDLQDERRLAEAPRTVQNNIVAAVDDAKHVAHDPLAVEKRPAGNARPVFEWILHADIIPKTYSGLNSSKLNIFSMASTCERKRLDIPTIAAMS